MSHSLFFSSGCLVDIVARQYTKENKVLFCFSSFCLSLEYSHRVSNNSKCTLMGCLRPQASGSPYPQIKLFVILVKRQIESQAQNKIYNQKFRQPFWVSGVTSGTEMLLSD